MDPDTEKRLELFCFVVSLSIASYTVYLLAKHWGWIWFLS